MRKILFVLFLAPLTLIAQSFKLEIPNYSSWLEIGNAYEFQANQYTILVADENADGILFSQIMDINHKGEIVHVYPIRTNNDDFLSVKIEDLYQYQGKWILKGTYRNESTNEEGLFYHKTANLNQLRFDNFTKIKTIDAIEVRNKAMIQNKSILKDSVLHILGNIDSAAANYYETNIFGIQIDIANNKTIKYKSKIRQGYYSEAFEIDINNNYVVFGQNPLIMSPDFELVTDYYFGERGIYRRMTTRQWNDSIYLTSGGVLDINVTPLSGDNLSAVFLNIKDFSIASDYFTESKDDKDLSKFKYGAWYRSLDWYDRNSIYLGGTIDFTLYFAPHLKEEAHTIWAIANLNDKLKKKWVKYFPSGDYYDLMYSILACSDGGVLAAGSRYDFKTKSSFVYVLKLAPDGTISTIDNDGSAGNNQDIQIFPNPTRNSFYISLADKETQVQIVCYDIYGRLCYRSDLFQQFNQISTADWQTGLYTIQVNDSNGKTLSIQKVLVQ